VRVSNLYARIVSSDAVDEGIGGKRRLVARLKAQVIDAFVFER
jgi:hypothetical protein